MNLRNFFTVLDDIIVGIFEGDKGYVPTPVAPAPVVATIPVMEPSKVAPTTENPFLEFCGFIKTYEGANPANNNPYDFRFYFGGYLPKYGVVKESVGGFAMFETLELGEMYGQTCITEMVMNHPEWNFLDFFTRFAPPSDNNDTALYAKTIATEMGVDVSANLKSTLKL